MLAYNNINVNIKKSVLKHTPTIEDILLKN